MEFENKAKIGYGIYTLSDLARILGLDYQKVRRLLNEYWDKRFSGDFGEKYSWTVKNSRAVSFHTLIEFYIFYQIKAAGVSTQRILMAHQELAMMYNTPFPFANSVILNGLHCVGKKIVFEIEKGNIIDLDSTKQLNLQFVKEFIRKLDFDSKNIALRLYPLGKSNSIVVDPNHQFGQATISGTNIFPETIFNLHKKKETKRFISKSYGLSLKQVSDAIDYCMPKAA